MYLFGKNFTFYMEYHLLGVSHLSAVNTVVANTRKYRQLESQTTSR